MSAEPKGQAMKPLQTQVFCSQCGAMRICRRDSPYAVCPNGHGRLVPRFTKREARQASSRPSPAPAAWDATGSTIAGHAGPFRLPRWKRSTAGKARDEHRRR